VSRRWGAGLYGQILQLEPSRQRDLALCTGVYTIRDIHVILCDRFEVPPERVVDDLVALVNGVQGFPRAEAQV
jgi:hypothetical protein